MSLSQNGRTVSHTKTIFVNEFGKVKYTIFVMFYFLHGFFILCTRRGQMNINNFTQTGRKRRSSAFSKCTPSRVDVLQVNLMRIPKLSPRVGNSEPITKSCITLWHHFWHEQKLIILCWQCEVFVCLSLNGTSAFIRLLLPRIIEVKHIKHVKKRFEIDK